MLLITRLGATREGGFPKPLGWGTIPCGPQSVGHSRSREEGLAACVGNQQVKAKAESHIAPHLRAWRLSWKMRGVGVGTRNPWIPELLCGPEWGVVSETTACAAKGHPSCLGDERPGINIRALPSPGLAPQTSRCIKKSQSPLSPFSGQSTGRGGCRALLKAGGSDEAGAFCLLVPSLLSLCASSRENPSAGDLKKEGWCVCGGWWESGVPRRWGGGRGTQGCGGSEQPALVWVRGNGRHRGDGLPAGAQHHGSFVWAAAAHGWVSNHYTEHLQTDKKTNPLGTNGNFCFPSFHDLSLSPLLEGFPGGRSGWLLAPQTSPDPISSNHSSPMTTTVYRQKPVCKMFIKPSGPLIKQHSLLQVLSQNPDTESHPTERGLGFPYWKVSGLTWFQNYLSTSQ